jgi:hypothetical protein
MMGVIRTAARRMPNFAFINRFCISATTVRKPRTGAMTATKRMNNWSAIATETAMRMMTESGASSLA